MENPLNNTVYEYSDLTDAEILELEARKRAEAAKDADQERRRVKKSTSFRFKGGMI